MKFIIKDYIIILFRSVSANGKMPLNMGVRRH